jgi:sugar-specific transcriptional regulator TrmB
MVDPTELSGCLKGRTNLYNHIESMVKGAEETITIMTTSQGLIRKAETMKAAFERAKKKGVRIRIAAPLTRDTEKAVKELSRFAEIKNTDSKSRFCVIDGKHVAFMLLDDDKVHPTYDAGVWVNTKLFASTLENFFEQCWSKMKPSDKFLKAA